MSGQRMCHAAIQRSKFGRKRHGLGPLAEPRGTSQRFSAGRVSPLRLCTFVSDAAKIAVGGVRRNETRPPALFEKPTNQGGSGSRAGGMLFASLTPGDSGCQAD